jgi:hypothetical protein
MVIVTMIIILVDQIFGSCDRCSADCKVAEPVRERVARIGVYRRKVMFKPSRCDAQAVRSEEGHWFPRN